MIFIDMYIANVLYLQSHYLITLLIWQ